MIEVLKAVPIWFLLFIIFIMGGLLTAFGAYCTWSIKKIFTDLKDSIKDLKDLIAKLFDKHDDHEERLSRLEGRCDVANCPKKVT